MNSNIDGRNELHPLWWGLCAATFVLISGAGGGAQAAEVSRQPIRGPFLQNLQTHEVTVCWETSRPHTGEVVVFDHDGKPAGKFADQTKVNRHEVVVDGLLTGRRYSYQVLGAGELLGKGSFRAAPARGEPFSFVAWGDSRSNPRTSAALAKQILQTQASFCIHSGDLVGDGKRLDHWDEQFFRPLAALLHDVVLWPAVGNHDTGMMPDGESTVFNHMFALPGKESYYSFDYGDAHFIVLDSTSSLDEQVAFAEEDLSRTDAKWRFAAWHHPPFSSGSHQSHVQSRTQLLPVLARHTVDMIILGHNHHFMRSRPIRHVYEPLQKRPYVQLVTGGGGANQHDLERDARWFAEGAKVHHCVLIEIDGDTLKAKVIDGQGHVLDRFEIDKTRPMGDAVAFELIELERYLRGLDNVNTTLEGWPTGLVLEPVEKRGQMKYSIRNPLHEEIGLRLEFDLSAGLSFDPGGREVEVPAGRTIEIEAPFRVTSPENLYPVRGPSVSFECSLGKGQVRAGEPLVGLGRRIIAHKTSGKIVVDGKADEDDWSKSTEHGRFVRWDVRNLAYQPPDGESTLRAVHDKDHLYLQLQRPASKFEDRDHFSVYLASPHKALGVIARVNGEHGLEGTKGIEEGVTAVRARDEGGITWEIRIPLANFRDDLDDACRPLWLNVMEQRGNQFFTLAPTFHQHPNRTNSAILVLE